MAQAVMQIKETDLLKPVGSTIVPARDKPFDPEVFYQNRPGLYVYESFKARVLPALKPVDQTPERPYVVARLKKAARDRKIRKDLPENHLSSAEDIAWMIEAQANGQEGFLLADRCVNSFYLEGVNGEVFAVDVDWGSSFREWRVGGWQHGGCGAGSQVLCPGNATL